jgi:hypothetical protein
MSLKIRFAQLGDHLGVPLLNDWLMADFVSDAPVSRRNNVVGGNAQLTACGVRSEPFGRPPRTTEFRK